MRNLALALMIMISMLAGRCLFTRAERERSDARATWPTRALRMDVLFFRVRDVGDASDAEPCCLDTRCAC